MRKMGIKTVMITGDNPLTAKAIADESGVDDFLAEATPNEKMALIKKEQHLGDHPRCSDHHRADPAGAAQVRY
jgi:potassium-transporting ATPase ATP-binding subunit